MINFYHRFVLHVAEILRPLYDALKGKPPPKVIDWTPSRDAAFSAAKQALADATMLVHPVDGAPTSLHVDASQVAMGASLEQHLQGQWKPVGFWSKPLRNVGKHPETEWSAFDRELLGARLATRHFRYFLEGRAFHIYTDQNSLVPAIRKKSEPHNARQTNHLAELSEYTTDFRHIEGKKNVVADALSRIVLPAPSALSATIAAVEAVDFAALAADQANDADVCRLRNGGSPSLRLETVQGPGFRILCDISTGHPRPVVPASHRRRIFEAVHGLSHPSIRATRKLLSSKFVWPSLAKDAATWTRACIPCQSSKIKRHTHAPVQDFPVPDARFQHVHVDLVGPLPPSHGFTYLFTIIDRFTRWPEAIPISDTSAVSLARAFISGWIARFGVPTTVTSDRGPQFTSDVWSNVTRLLGIEISLTAAYHPESNGLVERLHRSLKQSLRARLTGPEWADQLPWVLLGLRTTPKEDLKSTVAELVYGSTIILPGDFILPAEADGADAEFLRHLRGDIARLRPTPTSRHGNKPSYIPTPLRTAEFVFIRHDATRRPLQRPYNGPFRVVRRNEKDFVIDFGDRGEDTVSIDRLIPCFVDPVNPPALAVPPRRGRPPAQPPAAPPAQVPPAPTPPAQVPPAPAPPAVPPAPARPLLPNFLRPPPTLPEEEMNPFADEDFALPNSWGGL